MLIAVNLLNIVVCLKLFLDHVFTHFESVSVLPDFFHPALFISVYISVPSPNPFMALSFFNVKKADY